MTGLFWYDFPLCRLGVAEGDGSITRVFFSHGEHGGHGAHGGRSEGIETPLIKKTALQLSEYFDGKRKTFDVPLALAGTDFQVKVWNALLKIPYGKTASYGELAKRIGNPKACRAVGMANNRNPIPIIIPCHRIIGHDGNLTGYAGGLELKQKLLNLEKS